MAKKVDPDELVDAAQIAPMIGIANPRGVSVYRRRYTDFPAPVIDRGQCVLWLRQDVERWAEGRAGR